MKQSIKTYIQKKAKKNFFDDAMMINDLIHSAEIAYDYYIQRGTQSQYALKLSLASLGNLDELFLFSNPMSQTQGDKLSWIAHISCVALAIVNLLLFYFTQNTWPLVFLFPLILLIGLSVLKGIVIHKRIKSAKQRAQEIKKMIFCSGVNLVLIVPALMGISPIVYYQMLGYLFFISNLLYIFIVSKKVWRLLLISIPAIIVSTLLFFSDINYLILLELVLLIILSLLVFVVFEFNFHHQYDIIVVVLALLFIVLCLAFPEYMGYLIGLFIMCSTLFLVGQGLIMKYSTKEWFQKALVMIEASIYLLLFNLLISIMNHYFVHHFGLEQLTLDIYYPIFNQIIVLFGILSFYKYVLYFTEQYYQINTHHFMTNYDIIKTEAQEKDEWTRKLLQRRASSR